MERWCDILLILIVVRLTRPQIVDEASALIGLPNEKRLPIEANHRTMCKIPSADSQEYQALGAWIVKLTKSVVEEASIVKTQGNFASLLHPFILHPYPL